MQECLDQREQMEGRRERYTLVSDEQARESRISRGVLSVRMYEISMESVWRIKDVVEDRVINTILKAKDVEMHNVKMR